MSPLRRAVGLVLIMIGAVWFMLGSGMLGGSVMTGQTVWAIVGAMIAIVGLWIVTRRPAPTPPAEADGESPDPTPGESPDSTPGESPDPTPGQDKGE